MTIASEANRSGPYDCDGVATHFPYGFQLYDETHIRAILTAPDGSETTLVPGTDYAVSGVGENGGDVITSVAHGAGHRVTLILNVPFTQNVDLENQGAYFAETIERALDLQTQMSLQLKEQVARSVVLPVTSSVSVDKLTGAVLSLSEIQPQMQALAPIAEEIKTVAGISGAVVAAEGHAGTATAAAGVATSKAAEAAASAEAAATFDPADFYPRAEFKADGTFDAPVRYGPGGELTARGLRIDVAPGASRILRWLSSGVLRWAMLADSSGEVGSNAGCNFDLRAYDDSGAALGTVFSVERATQIMKLSQVPYIGGVPLTSMLGGLKNIRLVAASGNIQPTSGTTKWLGGLVGGGATAAGVVGGSGGAGSMFLAAVSDATQYAVVIGGVGGNSSIVIGGTTYSANGNGGSATGGLLNVQGAPGQLGSYGQTNDSVASFGLGGSGGDGPFGLGIGGIGHMLQGYSYGNGVTKNGNSGIGYGAGGGGYANTKGGATGTNGAGTPGCLLLLEF